MRKLSNIEERITNHLKVSEGSTTRDIARSLSIGIGTASKYLEVLHVKGLIYQKQIGPSNYWTLPKFSEIFENFEKFKGKLTVKDNGDLTLDDMSFIVLPISTYTELIENMVKKFGYEKVKGILYSVGREEGVKLYNKIHLSTKLEGLSLLNAILNFLKFLGYGRLYLKNTNIASGQLSIIYNHSLKFKNSAHFLIAGILGGVASKLTGLNLECTETKRIVKGASHCEFLTKPTK